MKNPTQSEIIAYITQAAQARGIDPQTAILVARGEGLNARPQEGWQSFVPAPQGPNGREDSWGIYQLLKSHKGKPMGVGHDMLQSTGLDPADPSNWQPSIDYALDYAAKNGWSAWYGAKAKGVGPWDGIKNAKAIGVTSSQTPDAPPTPAMGTSMGGFMDGPTAVAQRQAKVDPSTPDITAENSSVADTTQTPQTPNFPTSQNTPAKSPQEIYTEYLSALRFVTERRQPQPLNLATLDIVSYDQ